MRQTQSKENRLQLSRPRKQRDRLKVDKGHVMVRIRGRIPSLGVNRSMAEGYTINNFERSVK